MFGYSNFLQIEEITSQNLVLASFITAINRIGTSGFIFISGYYLSGKGTVHNIKKIVSFLLEINFFSVCILLASVVFTKQVSINVVIQSLMPIVTQHYWYPFNYVLLLLLYPYLNTLIGGLNKKAHLTLLLLLAGICCVYLKVDIFYTSSVFLGHSSHGFLWWVLLYFTAGYIQKYNVEYNSIWGIVFFAACGIAGTVFILLARQHPLLNQLELADDNSILGYCGTISLFLIFRNSRIIFGEKTKAILRYLVPATFTAYLFQEHNAVRSILWKTVNIEAYASGSSLLLLGRMCLTFLILWGIGFAFYLLYAVAKRVYLNRVCSAIVRVIEFRLKD